MARDLTPGEREYGMWIACEEPERPFDDKMVMHNQEDCRACVIKRSVMVEEYGDVLFLDEKTGAFVSMQDMDGRRVDAGGPD